MASSSKKSIPEKEKKKKKETTQETKPTKTPKKKSNNISTTKTNRPEVKNTTSNGNVSVSDSDAEVIVIRSSSTESQEEEQKHRSAVSSKKTNGTKSNKGKQKQQEEEEEDDVKLNRFPMNRIKTIIRGGDSDIRVNQEAIFLVNKATEKFIEKFTEDGHACCVKDRKKSLSYNHLSSAVCKRRRYNFLSDFVPVKLQAVDALAERQITETGAG